VLGSNTWTHILVIGVVNEKNVNWSGKSYTISTNSCIWLLIPLNLVTLFNYWSLTLPLVFLWTFFFVWSLPQIQQVTFDYCCFKNDADGVRSTCNPFYVPLAFCDIALFGWPHCCWVNNGVCDNKFIGLSLLNLIITTCSPPCSTWCILITRTHLSMLVVWVEVM